MDFTIDSDLIYEYITKAERIFISTLQTSVCFIIFA